MSSSSLTKSKMKLSGIGLHHFAMAYWKKSKRLLTSFRFCVFFPDPFNCFYNVFLILQVFHYAAYLYDAVYLYALALNKTFSNGQDPRDGAAVFHNIRRTSFESKPASKLIRKSIRLSQLYLFI